MAEFYERRKMKRLMYSPPALALFAIVVALLASGAWGAYQKQSETGVKRAEAAAALAESTAREAALTNDLAKLDSESGTEAEIRDRFDVGKDGEHEIVVVDSASPTTTAPMTPPTPWWKKLLSWF
jgi:hypothetical protein